MTDKPRRNFVGRTIWTGDNLEILRGLNSETVDMIYLDPPFNSHRTYSAPIGSKGRRGGVRGYLDSRQRGRGLDGVDRGPVPRHP